MPTQSQRELLQQLTRYDTPTITNVVATYPADEQHCLGLYHPWEGAWYTDQSLRCMFPELGPRAGYAVTCVYGLPDPGFHRLGFSDVLRAVAAAPGPVILVIKQDFPDHIKNKNGLSGGNMTTALQRVGAVGVISDGPSRDIHEIREMNFQYLLTGVCAGHGDFAVKAVNVPVRVCGMDVCPGDILHMDENGAVKFPQASLAEVLHRAQALSALEEARIARMREAGDVEEVIRILEGFEE